MNEIVASAILDLKLTTRFEYFLCFHLILWPVVWLQVYSFELISVFDVLIVSRETAFRCMSQQRSNSQLWSGYFLFFISNIFIQVKTFSHWLFSHVALCTHITSTHIKYTKYIKSILEVKVQ